MKKGLNLKRRMQQHCYNGKMSNGQNAGGTFEWKKPARGSGLRTGGIRTEKEADPAAICIFYAEKTDGTENPRGGKFSCLISGGERRSEGFRAFLRRFLRTHGEEINILKNP